MPATCGLRSDHGCLEYQDDSTTLTIRDGTRHGCRTRRKDGRGSTRYQEVFEGFQSVEVSFRSRGGRGGRCKRVERKRRFPNYGNMVQRVSPDRRL